MEIAPFFTRKVSRGSRANTEIAGSFIGAIKLEAGGF